MDKFMSSAGQVSKSGLGGLGISSPVAEVGRGVAVQHQRPVGALVRPWGFPGGAGGILGRLWRV